MADLETSHATLDHTGLTGVGSAPAESDVTFTDITTNNASTSKHGYLKKLDNNAAHFMDGTGAWSTPSASLTTTEDILSGDVTMTNAATWYDGPSHSLTAGTYIIWGKVMLQLNNAAGSGMLARLSDGTTVYDASEMDLVANNGQIVTVPLGPCVVVLGSTTTVKIQGQDQARTGSKIKATGGTGMPTDNSTRLVTIKVA